MVAEEGLEREIKMARGQEQRGSAIPRNEGKLAARNETSETLVCDAHRRASDLPTPLATDSQFFFFFF